MKTKLQLGIYRFYNETNKSYETIILTKAFNKFYWSTNSYKTLDFSVLKEGSFGKRKVNNSLLEFNFFKNKYPRINAEILSETSFQISEVNNSKKFIKENDLGDIENKSFSLKLTLILFIAMSLFFIHQMVKPYFNNSLERQKASIEIPSEIKILTTKSTFITSKGMGKLRFPVIQEEENINLYVTSKRKIYKMFYYKDLGSVMSTILPIKSVTDKKVTFDVLPIKKIKILYNPNDEITELKINDTVIKPFQEKKFTMLKMVPTIIAFISFVVFSFLLVILWNEP